MTKNSYFIFISIIGIIITVTISTFFWEHIKLEFNNYEEVLGSYSESSHNQHNDTLRFLSFISFPLIFYFILCMVFYKKDFIGNIKNLFNDEYEVNFQEKNNIKIYLYFFLALIIFGFFLTDLPLSEIDIFHEGQRLGGGYNFHTTGKLWTHNYINTSLFMDILVAPISWKLFGVNSIGSVRFVFILINMLAHLSLMILFYNIVLNLNISKNTKIIFFLALSIFSFYIIENGILNFRDIPIILALSFTLNIICRKKINYVAYISLGFLSIFAVLLSFDRGVYLNLFYLFLILVLLLLKKNKEIFIFFITIFVFWFFFIFIIGPEEFKQFVINAFEVIKYHELLNGLIHSKPFSDQIHSTRATRNFLIVLINGIILISIICFDEKIFPKKYKIFLTLFFVVGIICYKTGLSRSDGIHMRKAIGFNLIQFITYLFIIIIKLQRKFLINFNYFFSFKILSTVFLILIVIVYLRNFNFYNFYNFNSRVEQYVNYEDKIYLSNSDQELIVNLKDIYKNKNCIQLFNFDSAISYLIKKKSCTKYNFLWGIGSKTRQLKFVDELKIKKPEFILIGGPYDKWGISPNLRFPYVAKYLEDNYAFHFNVNSRQLLKRK